MSSPPRFLQCRHRLDASLPRTLSYCLALSSIFVCSLYVLVPPPVRRLPRDDPSHVRWRAVIVLAVSAAGVGAYPWLFCDDDISHHGDNVSSSLSSPPPWYAYLGFTWTPMQDVRIAMHVLSLYLGALSCSWLRVYHHGRILRREEEEEERMLMDHRKEGGGMRRQLPISPRPKHLLRSLATTRLRPMRRYLASLLADEGLRWTTVRDLAVAPLAEEAIFRSCLLPPLLAACCRRGGVETAMGDDGSSRGRGGGALSPASASWIAPLFFGVAHLHHLYERIRRIPPAMRSNKAILTRIILGVVVQWTYTTLFGAYASHVFVRTGSLGAATTAHVVCNYMGLPEVGPFVDPTSILRGYRWFIATMYLAGIWLFVSAFDSPAIFPGESVLPSLLYPATVDGPSSSQFVAA